MDGSVYSSVCAQPYRRFDEKKGIVISANQARSESQIKRTDHASATAAATSARNDMGLVDRDLAPPFSAAPVGEADVVDVPFELFCWPLLPPELVGFAVPVALPLGETLALGSVAPPTPTVAAITSPVLSAAFWYTSALARRARLSNFQPFCAIRG